MRSIVLVLMFVGSFMVVQANSSEVSTKAEVNVSSSNEEPTTVIIRDGLAFYTDDGNDCTINLDNGTAYGPGC